MPTTEEQIRMWFDLYEDIIKRYTELMKITPNQGQELPADLYDAITNVSNSLSHAGTIISNHMKLIMKGGG